MQSAPKSRRGWRAGQKSGKKRQSKAEARYTVGLVPARSSSTPGGSGTHRRPARAQNLDGTFGKGVSFGGSHLTEDYPTLGGRWTRTTPP
jgi:hypothetical protein